jgi:hypothetical protein
LFQFTCFIVAKTQQYEFTRPLRVSYFSIYISVSISISISVYL